jgi:hypothetical protein
VDAKEQEAIWSGLWIAYGGHIERRRRRFRRAKIAALGLIATLTVVGAATGALVVLVAPTSVQSDLAAVDQGLPADLRLNPDVSAARLVASDGSSALFAADLRNGGYCGEIVTGSGRARGAICATRGDLRSHPIEVALPSDDSASNSSPMTIGGRVNATADRLEIVYGDGSTGEIPLADDRFFVFEVPTRHREGVHLSETTLIARDERGAITAQTSIPADWDGHAVPDESQALFVSTYSDSSDFTKVDGIEGHVAAPVADSLELRYVDGKTATIPLDGGRYVYTVPSSRAGDFMRPQLLVALDRSGNVVARAQVAAVAYWVRKERSR